MSSAQPTAVDIKTGLLLLSPAKAWKTRRLRWIRHRCLTVVVGISHVYLQVHQLGR